LPSSLPNIMLKTGLRSFLKGTVCLCRSKGWKVAISQTLRMILSCRVLCPSRLCVLHSGTSGRFFFRSPSLQAFLFAVFWPTHYGRFWVILSQNWSLNFHYCGCIFMLYLKIIASKAQKPVDSLPGFKFFEIYAKLHL